MAIIMSNTEYRQQLIYGNITISEGNDNIMIKNYS